MTYKEIVEYLVKLAKEYREYSNYVHDEKMSYRDRVFYSGLAIETLQNIQEVAGRYPVIIQKLPPYTLPEYNREAIYRLFERQRYLYLEELKKIKARIKDGTYNISDEMHLKVERMHDITNIIKSNQTLNTAPGAKDVKRHALLSIIGTAFKYPVHIVNRVLEAGVHIVGRVLTLPLHLVSYPIKRVIKPNSPYTGKKVEDIGYKLSNFLSTGVRVIDQSIKKL